MMGAVRMRCEAEIAQMENSVLYSVRVMFL